ncbi:unnamed protein product [Protopolystoma xenopodis]|uniref:Uncharacterized protein n=1 Tax=Protopolystoma xenopodis TaxID=117903 RepID=A0A3S5BKJ7_9PLAT|nr:unnamed protein product [Protopolystoma xenopodis]
MTVIQDPGFGIRDTGDEASYQESVSWGSEARGSESGIPNMKLDIQDSVLRICGLSFRLQAPSSGIRN